MPRSAAIFATALALAAVACGPGARPWDPLKQGHFACPDGALLVEERHDDDTVAARRCVQPRAPDEGRLPNAIGKTCRWAAGGKLVECSCYIMAPDGVGPTRPQWTTSDPQEAARRDCPERREETFQIDAPVER